MTPHAVVSHSQWLDARKALLAKEKAFTRARDALSGAAQGRTNFPRRAAVDNGRAGASSGRDLRRRRPCALRVGAASR